MLSGWKTAVAAGLLGAGGIMGCQPDRPHEYGQMRQPVDELNAEDRGLQSKDVVDAADKISRDLLADPTLNATPGWRMVVSNMEDKTTDNLFRTNFDIFLQALKGDLAQKSGNRIQLIENKQEFHDLQNKELENQPGDFGQGAGNQAGNQAINPDFALYGTAMDLPNRATNFYQIEFKVVNLKNRTIAFDRLYQVKVAR